jgi:hypothetical protein
MVSCDHQTNYACFGAACAAVAGPRVPIDFRNSREHFRRSIFCFRNRPNLDLSPFLSDTIASFVSLGLDSFTALGFRHRPHMAFGQERELRYLLPHRDRLPGVRLVMEGMERTG